MSPRCRSRSNEPCRSRSNEVMPLDHAIEGTLSYGRNDTAAAGRGSLPLRESPLFGRTDRPLAQKGHWLRSAAACQVVVRRTETEAERRCLSPFPPAALCTRHVAAFIRRKTGTNAGNSSTGQNISGGMDLP